MLKSPLTSVLKKIGVYKIMRNTVHATQYMCFALTSVMELELAELKQCRYFYLGFNFIDSNFL